MWSEAYLNSVNIHIKILENKIKICRDKVSEFLEQQIKVGIELANDSRYTAPELKPDKLEYLVSAFSDE